MSYRVVWLNALEQRLINIYMQADADGNANAVTRATHLIDQGLQANPLDVGESRTGNSRFASFHPLHIWFEVYAQEQVVLVTTVRYQPLKNQ